MARLFRCPYLDADVELTDERESHVMMRHPGLGAGLPERLTSTLAEPGLVMQSRRSPSALLFSRWYDDLLNGKFLVVVVEGEAGRRWIVTAHPSEAEIRGEVLWRRS